MKKTIRLTESDLIKLVERVIKEQSSMMDDDSSTDCEKLYQQVEQYFLDEMEQLQSVDKEHIGYLYTKIHESINDIYKDAIELGCDMDNLEEMIDGFMLDIEDFIED